MVPLIRHVLRLFAHSHASDGEVLMAPEQRMDTQTLTRVSD
jgi:hypothetical protein